MRPRCEPRPAWRGSPAQGSGAWFRRGRPSSRSLGRRFPPLERREVLVAAAGQTHEDDRIVGERRGRARTARPPGAAQEDPRERGERVGRLERRQDPFRARQVADRGHGVIVGRGDDLHAPRLVERGKLRPDPRVVEPSRDRVRLGHLSVAVLEHVGPGAVEDARRAPGERGGVSTRRDPLPFSLGRHEPDGRFADEAREEADRVGAAALAGGTPGILHGARSYMLQDRDGQVTEAHSISAGLDYPGVGPQLSALYEAGRMEVVSTTDDDAVAAIRDLSRAEGILPALEPAHALAALPRILLGRTRGPGGPRPSTPLPDDAVILVGLSGRGDKDLAALERREETAQ